MPITFKSGSIFESKCQTIVNTVNCVGTMGKGLALQFKQSFGGDAGAFNQAYLADCRSGMLTTSRPRLFKVSPERWILNWATKQDWRNDSKLEWIEASLQYFVANYQRAGITSIAIPPLGCGNGGLDQVQVLTLLMHYLHDLSLPVELYGFGPEVQQEIEMLLHDEQLFAAWNDQFNAARGAIPERVAIVGSRDYPNLEQVRAYVRLLPAGTTVISGGARGVDSTAEQEARLIGLSVESIPADWNRYGKSAGFKRNRDIIAACSRVVAFWDGQSRGTAHDIQLAEEMNKPCEIIRPHTA